MAKALEDTKNDSESLSMEEQLKPPKPFWGFTTTREQTAASFCDQTETDARGPDMVFVSA